LIRHKKEIKKISLLIIYINLILISNFTRINEFPQNSKEENIMDPIYEDTKDKLNFPKTSDITIVNQTINGTGVDRTVRLFANNQSTTPGKQGYFEIEPPNTGTDLNYGDFYFNFDNNFTTDYIVEDDNALYPDIPNNYFDTYHYNKSTSYLEVHNGTEFPKNGFNSLITESKNFNISSENGVVNFTISADFSGVKGVDRGMSYTPLIFNRENIIGFILNFSCNVTQVVNATIFMKDFSYPSNFINVTPTFEINSSLNTQDIDRLLINENLKFINTSGWCLIRFVFERVDATEFNITVFNDGVNNFDIYSFMVVELPISAVKHVALEFDLRGENSTVNGFYAWIRTLNLDKAKNTNLTISLYYANDTMARTVDNINQRPGSTKIKPNISYSLISSKNWTGFEKDEYYYFSFDSTETSNLNRYNYFIVIKSNSSDDDIYRIVCIPQGVHGDGDEDEDVEHLFMQSSNGGLDWTLAEFNINDYAIDLKELDVSQFKLNVTRGYMPSDFIFNNEKTLRIQNITVDNVKDLMEDITGLSYIARDEVNLTWGVGRWNHFFTPSLKVYGGKFRVNITWNATDTGIMGFKFNINYTVEVYRSDTISTFYRAKYNDLPEWIFNYSLGLENDLIFEHEYWNFTQFWYLYPEYYTAHDITIPNSTRILNISGMERTFNEIPNYKRFVMNTSIIDLNKEHEFNGTYYLNLTSPNAVDDMHSYINFDGILWETFGFMYGDNISVKLDIRDPYGNAPKNTNAFANVSFFYPNGTKFPKADLNAILGKISTDNGFLYYDFDNETILDVTKAIPLEDDLNATEHYSMGFFWTNSSMVGCKKIPIYIDSYKINLSDLTYEEDNGVNVLAGTPINTVLDKYSLLIATINGTTNIDTPNFYPLNNSLSQATGTYSYVTPYTGENLNVFMKAFLQN